MDRTREVIDWLLADKQRVINAITLVEDTQKYEYNHALNWYGDAGRAAEYVLEHSYYEMADQFDVNGSWGMKDRNWFPGSKKYDIAYSNPAPDHVDWLKVMDAMYKSPFNPHLSSF
jgi:hypothetical protein